MYSDLPVIPKINYDFDSEPNIFDNESEEFGEDGNAVQAYPPSYVTHHDHELNTELNDAEFNDDEHNTTELGYQPRYGEYEGEHEHHSRSHSHGPPSPLPSPSPPPLSHPHSSQSQSTRTVLSSPHKHHQQPMHDLEVQNDKIRAVVHQMRRDMKHGLSGKRDRSEVTKNASTATDSKQHEQLLQSFESDTDYDSSMDHSKFHQVSNKDNIKYATRDMVNSGVTPHTRELERLLARSQDELLAAINEIQDYETQISSCRAELTSCKFAIRQKQVNLQNSHRQIAMLQRQCDSNQDDLHAVREKNKMLEAQVAELQLELHLLKSDSHQSVPQLLHHRSEGFDKLAAENRFLRMKMEEATKDIKRLTHEKEKLIDISNMLRADMVAMSDSLASSSESPPMVIEHYESKITDLEMLIRKLDLHNKVLKKDLEDKHSEERSQKINSRDIPIGVVGYPIHHDAKVHMHLPSKETSLDKKVRSQKQPLDPRAKLLEQRSTISQTIQKKNNK